MSPPPRRRVMLGAGLAALPLSARAQKKSLKIGILTDMSGPYAEATGQGDVVASRLAIEDFTRQVEPPSSGVLGEVAQDVGQLQGPAERFCDGVGGGAGIASNGGSDDDPQL